MRINRRQIKMKDVMIVTGSGQISQAIARQIGFGKKLYLEIRT